MSRINAKEVAEYFLYKSDLSEEEEPDFITNLKLQKLLYYAQGYHLGMYGEALFEEEIRNWTHGPVVPEVYDVYKSNGSAPIKPPKDFDPDLSFSAEQQTFLDEVYRLMGQFSAWRLRELTHQEPPWLQTEQNERIPEDLMRSFFETLVADAEPHTAA